MHIVNGEAHATKDETAKLLGISTKTLGSYIKDGKVPPPPTHARGANKQWYYFPADYIAKVVDALNTPCQDVLRRLEGSDLIDTYKDELKKHLDDSA